MEAKGAGRERGAMVAVEVSSDACFGGMRDMLGEKKGLGFEVARLMWM
jgi:hypothetical protein